MGKGSPALELIVYHRNVTMANLGFEVLEVFAWDLESLLKADRIIM